MDFDVFFKVLETIPTWPAIISFSFLTVIVLMSLIYTRFHWIFKGAIIMSSLLVFGMAYMAITNSFGWPYSHHLPHRFQVIGVDVREPMDNDKGAIRYWTREADKNFSVNPMPRVYEIPYTKERHKQAIQLKKRLQNNETVFGESGEGNGQGKGVGVGKGKGQGRGQGEGRDGNGHGSGRDFRGGQGLQNEGSGYDFEVIRPPNRIPPKDGEPEEQTPDEDQNPDEPILQPRGSPA